MALYIICIYIHAGIHIFKSYEISMCGFGCVSVCVLAYTCTLLLCE